MIFALKVAGMLGGVALLTEIARALKLGGEARIQSADHARALAFEYHYGFNSVDAAVDATGKAALVVGADRRHILICVKGPRFISRLLDKDTQTRLEQGRLTVAVREPDFPITTLNLGEAAPRWAFALERQIYG